MKPKCYAVARGHIPGIYHTWYGEKGAEIQVKGFPDALFKGFPSVKDAKQWYKEMMETGGHSLLIKKKTPVRNTPANKKTSDISTKKTKVIIYTDGSCIRNPGSGGYGVVLMDGTHRKELSGGFRLTTNNRMELMAGIVGLKELNFRCQVTLYSDSRYVVFGITKGWAKRWRKNGWMRGELMPAENADLWEQLLDLCDKHSTSFIWVKGHAGTPENERCDQLATYAAGLRDLPPDTAYEEGKTRRDKQDESEIIF